MRSVWCQNGQKEGGRETVVVSLYLQPSNLTRKPKRPNPFGRGMKRVEEVP